ncbi:MAG: RNA chaperone Hfq [Rhodobiaceae bacterium]|nr:RNA chaperone Hfq [Rhodobiaceae bacterium]|tara:strand:- start:407 stop:628 length:222 start_codon:yes stop_codon:yes gene_type:complete
MLDNSLENISKLNESDFIDSLINEARLVTIFLVSGIKLEGIITSFDLSTITLRGSNNNIQLVYKHAISTILPV